MLSLPDTWNYSLKGLISLCKENETAIRSTLKELKEFGYLEVIKKYSNETETHKYEYEYIVYENPKPQGKNQCVEDLCIEDPVVLNTDILNTKIDNSIINNKPELKKQLTAKQKNYITILLKSV